MEKSKTIIKRDRRSVLSNQAPAAYSSNMMINTLDPRFDKRSFNMHDSN